MAVTADGGGAAAAASLSLQDTPTWALATVCFIFISVSIFIEHMIHLISHWLKKHRQTALFEAVEKLKSVLMVLGFMSLILTVTQRGISKICVPIEVAETLLPCRRTALKNIKAIGSLEQLWANIGQSSFHERILAADQDSNHCPEMGSNFKSAVLEKEISNVLKKWHAVVRQKRKNQESSHGQDCSSRGSSSNKATAPCSLEFSSHQHRTPTFSENSAFTGINEILEENQPTHQGIVPSSEMEIEMPNLTFSMVDNGIAKG
ncbi:hypothetical protein SLEP1_g37807 [Rubroshorea leprosula]|uniref:MLO-like protein n=1 Tax=Rubroshorea leprosula TaxID=152421 RepID=A0AAV5KWQ2_9ROSI|nr:hypothetical protein SLEP1_g37807 [Rubroshorea leprosula]